jgi:N-acetylglutamate synthase-like GNAT family acetyltransferase
MSLTSAETFTTTDCRCVSLRRAVHADHEAVTTLLRDSQLPTDGLAEWLDQFWVAEHQGRVVGMAGMERYGDSGLLRSVAVTQEWRGTGIGRTLVDRVLKEGRAAGVREVYLLTTTAEHYFPRLGFGCVDRETVPAALQASAEFKGACPASAVVMRRTATN